MSASSFRIIYEDHHLLVVNKPAGIVMHPTYKNTEGTLWDAVLEHLQGQGGDDWKPPELPDEAGWAGASPEVRVMLRQRRTERMWQKEGLLPRPILLHRLDKDTSGVVVLARTQQSCRFLVRQFMEHTIVKRYLAVVQKGAPDWAFPRAALHVRWREGTAKARGVAGDGYASVWRRGGEAGAREEGGSRGEDAGAWEDVGALDEVGVGGRSENELDALFLRPFVDGEELLLDGRLQRDADDRRRCIVGSDGQDAQTAVKVLAVWGTFALLEARPITGRTHQIRAHLAALGYAIVGDRVYGMPPENGTAVAALKRQFLHAYCLEVRRYPDEARCTFVAPLAEDLVAWLEEYFPVSFWQYVQGGARD